MNHKNFIKRISVFLDNFFCSKGFTLLESLFAILVLAIGLLAVFGLVLYPISQGPVSQLRFTASYLAQEGIEVVRNIRDTNWVQSNFSWLPANIPPGDYEADYETSSLSSLNEWAASGTFLNIDSRQFYGYGPGVPSRFKRRISVITGIEDGIDILKVTATVYWQDKGKSYTYSAQGNLYGWYREILPLNCDGDFFNRDDSGTLGTQWDVLTGSFSVLNYKAAAPKIDGGNLAVWDIPVSGSNYYVQALIPAPSGNEFINAGPVTRVIDEQNFYGLVGGVDSSGIGWVKLFRVVSGAYQELAPYNNITFPAVLRLGVSWDEAVGNTLNVRIKDANNNEITEEVIDSDIVPQIGVEKGGMRASHDQGPVGLDFRQVLDNWRLCY